MSLIDHVARGLSKLPSQYENSENLKHLLQVFLEELHEIEVCLNDIQLQKDIDLAVGVQLDGIGEHLGKNREGLSDTDYRRVLKVKRIINAGEGQYSTMKSLWRTLLGSTAATVLPEYPAGVALYSDVGTPTIETLDLFTSALPSTVTASLLASYDNTDAFCFEGGVGAGFGTTGDSSIGGKLISRYTNVI